MTMLEFLKIVGSIITILTGLYSLFKPHAVQEFTGLSLPGPRGVTEVRTVLGGLFIAIGAAPLIFSSPDMFKMAGFGYLFVGTVRLISMILDGSYVQSNYISLAFELVFGVILFI